MDQQISFRKVKLSFYCHKWKQISFIVLAGQEEDEDEYNSEFLYDREAGILVEHIEIFLNMIESGNYKEASYVAACSPKGVLRNMETLLRFKGIREILIALLFFKLKFI